MHLLWTWCLTPGWAEVQKSSSTLLRKGHGGSGSRSNKEETTKMLRFAKKTQIKTKSTIQEEGITLTLCISYVCFLSTYCWSLLETRYLLQLVFGIGSFYVLQYCKMKNHVISQESSVLQTQLCARSPVTYE